MGGSVASMGMKQERECLVDRIGVSVRFPISKFNASFEFPAEEAIRHGKHP